MFSPNSAAIAVDPDALAWAELRHNMLMRLASIGMRVAEEIAERAVNSPYHPEPRHEPGRAFAAISRAVRLTLTLEARVAIYLLALRRGEVPPEPVARASRPPGERRASRDRDDVSECLIDRETLDEDEFLNLPSHPGQGGPKTAVADYDDTRDVGDAARIPTQIPAFAEPRAPAVATSGRVEQEQDRGPLGPQPP